MNSSSELIKLQQSVRESRISISREYSGLISDLDIRKRFIDSVRQHPLRWIGGAASAGLIATIFGGSKAYARKHSVNPAATSAPAIIGSSAQTALTEQGASALSKFSWLGGALEVGKLLYPILRPLVVEYVSNAAQAGLEKRRR